MRSSGASMEIGFEASKPIHKIGNSNAGWYPQPQKYPDINKKSAFRPKVRKD
jgi:hypothetical protein